MAKLTPDERKRISAKEFAEPKKLVMPTLVQRNRGNVTLIGDTAHGVRP
jgi:hypothetical protein